MERGNNWKKKLTFEEQYKLEMRFLEENLTELVDQTTEKVHMIKVIYPGGYRPPLDAKKPSKIPSQIGRYLVDREIGCGGYGVVYSAFDPQDRTNIVAIKRFAHCENKTESSEKVHPSISREATLREMYNNITLTHPNIAKFKEMLHSDEADYLVMSFYARCLTSLIGPKENVTVSEVMLRSLFKGLLEGLKYIHDKNMMHRDLKPENIMLKDAYTPIIIDLGLCRECGVVPDKLFSNEIQTPGYRPPEIVIGTKQYGQSVDIWSLGIIFLEVLFSERLVPPKKDLDETKEDEMNMLVQLLKHFHGKVPIPESFSNKLPGYRKFEEKYSQDGFGPENYIFKKSLPPFATNLLKRMLHIDPKQRITAEDALKHPFISPSAHPPSPFSSSQTSIITVTDTE